MPTHPPTRTLPAVAVLASSLLLAAHRTPAASLVSPEGTSEAAPHGRGNIYAPEVHRTAGGWKLWYGGQGSDGHDRIHLAESPDGLRWTRRGVVVDCGTNNHVNDPSVVRVGDVWWMFHTVAARAEEDAIAAATSPDGAHWTSIGVVLGPGPHPGWDSSKVGRPSVLHEAGRFRMWYDGQPTRAAADHDPTAARVLREARAVGYAESVDGRHWTRRPAPVLHGGAGAVHVRRWNGGHVLVHESHQGTRWAVSPDGFEWTPRGLLHPVSGGDTDRYGQVTPFLGPSPDGPGLRLYFGAASAATWDHNRIATADPVALRDEALPAYRLGYTRLRTDLPGGRHANVRTMRARIVRSDGADDRPVAPSLVDDPDAWTQFAGWTPDGRAAVVLRGWQDPANARWEEQHRRFRFQPGAWKLDIHLVDPETGTGTNLTAVERVSDYNSGLVFLPDGRTLGFTALVDGVSHPFLMDVDGRNKRDVSGDGGFAYGYGVSPDGTRISWHEDYQIRVARADGTGKRRIDTGFPFNFGPQWSPDGHWILFSAGVRGDSPPHVVRPDGTGLRRVADLGGYPGWTLFLDVDDFHEGSSDPPAWSSDGASVLYTAREGGSVELFSTTLEGVVRRWTRSSEGTAHYHPRPGPDGRRVAYGSRREGIRDLYVLDMRDDGRETRLTRMPPGHGALWPHWNPTPERP